MVLLIWRVGAKAPCKARETTENSLSRAMWRWSPNSTIFDAITDGCSELNRLPKEIRIRMQHTTENSQRQGLRSVERHDVSGLTISCVIFSLVLVGLLNRSEAPLSPCMTFRSSLTKSLKTLGCKGLS
jgi:hypothetical protein